jgi:hypothetical protein
MAQQSVPKLPAEFEVNTPSVEFFKLHLESDVRNRLLKTFGIPLGGGGILAIVAGLFWFLPAKVSEYIQTSEHVSGVIQEETERFLTKDPVGQGFILQSVAAYFRTPDAQHALSTQVTQYLASNDQGRRLLEAFFQTDQGRSAIAAAVQESFRSESIRSVITAAAAPAVEEALRRPEFAGLVRDATGTAALEAVKSPAFEALVKTSVDEALRPAIGALTTELQKNAGRTLVEAGDSSIGVEDLAKGGEIAKGGRSELELFVEREQAPGRSGPVTMSVQTRETPYYSGAACRMSARTLRDGLGDRFLGVVVYDRGGKFLAMLAPGAVHDRTIDAFWDPFVGLLNTNNEGELRALCEGVQAGSTRSLADACTVQQALRNAAWLSVPPGSRLAVTNSAGRLRGHTTRAMLLAAVTTPGS